MCSLNGFDPGLLLTMLMREAVKEDFRIAFKFHKFQKAFRSEKWENPYKSD